MGSVQAFPRKAGVQTIADVWRVAALGTAGTVRVREMRLPDSAAIRALQRSAAPSVPLFSVRQLESQRHAFAEGQRVAEANGVIVGTASALVVRWNDPPEPTWAGVTGEGFFGTHDPQGDTLFLAAIVADTTRRGFGIARALFQAQRRLCRQLNLRRILVATPLGGEATGAGGISPDLYARLVICGDVADPILRLQMSQGFQYGGVLHRFFGQGEGAGHAALMVWLNPLHTPPRPPALAQSERARKCA